MVCLGGDSGGETPAGEAVKGSAKVFDVENFGESLCGEVKGEADAGADMINILKLPYVPRACAWIHARGDGMTLVAMQVAPPLLDGRC